MNSYVERIEMLPFSLWDSLQISIPQAIFLLVAVASFGYWLLEKNKTGFKYGLFALFIFFSLRSLSFIKANNQHKLIVYNVPQKQAIDIIDGRNYLFVGDTDLLADDFVRNFHIKPARVLNRVEESATLNNYFQSENMIQYNGKKILLIDNNSTFISSPEKITVDLLVVSKNPKLYFKKLVESFAIKQVVFDGSVPSWKIDYWKRDCDSLHIPYHDVNEKGAFVMKLN
jgi:competence protein ComEC